MIGTAKRKAKNSRSYSQVANEPETPVGLSGGSATSQPSAVVPQPYQIPVDYSQPPLDARMSLPEALTSGASVATQGDARLGVLPGGLPKYLSAEGVSYNVDPTTGYYSVEVSPAGRFPGYSFRQIGPDSYEQRAASTLGNEVGGGFGAIQTSLHGGYQIPVEMLGLPQILQSRFDEAHPKPTKGSRLFDARLPSPYAKGTLTPDEAWDFAHKWAKDYGGNGVLKESEVDPRQSWLFGGNQPLSQGPVMGYEDPDPDIGFVTTSLANPNFTPAEMPNEHDVREYYNWLLGASPYPFATTTSSALANGGWSAPVETDRNRAMMEYYDRTGVVPKMAPNLNGVVTGPGFLFRDGNLVEATVGAKV